MGWARPPPAEQSLSHHTRHWASYTRSEALQRGHTRRPETLKIDIDDKERLGEGVFDNHCGRTDAGGHGGQLCEAALRHKWQSEGWSTQARGGLKGGGHPYHSAICEGWPMSVSMAVCVPPSRQLIQKVWLHAVRMARARGGAPLGSCVICDLDRLTDGSKLATGNKFRR